MDWALYSICNIKHSCNEIVLVDNKSHDDALMNALGFKEIQIITI